MKEVYIHTHLGLGDHFTCNGLVRNISKNYDKVFLFYKNLPSHLPNLKYMYRDMGDKINFIGGNGPNDNFVDSYRSLHPGINYIKIGFNYLYTTKLNFDQAFYEQANIPFNKKFDDFYIERDDEIESVVYNDLNPQNEPYVFIHQDINRGIYMNLNYIQNKKLKIIEPSSKYIVAHHAKIIEKATEVHLMESSFKCFVDGFLKDHDNMFFHVYMRSGVQAIGRNYWKIIK